MENATKAMLIAAGVLIGIMILSLGVTLFSGLQRYVESSNEKIEANDKNAFNTQFTKYINYTSAGKQFDLTIHDVVTAANLAYENNKTYAATEAERDNPSTLYMAVYLGSQPIEADIQNEASSYYITKLLTNNYKDKTYKCESTSVEISEETGRVYKIKFVEE